VCHAPLIGWVLATSVYRKGDCYCNHRITSIPRLAFEGLELSDGKLSRSVLRGTGGEIPPVYPARNRADIWFSPYDIATCRNP
jgi:hypothetical protein